MRIKEKVKKLEEQVIEMNYRFKQLDEVRVKFDCLSKHLGLFVVKKENEGPDWEVLTKEEYLKINEQKYQQKMGMAQMAANSRNIYDPSWPYSYLYTGQNWR